MADQDELDTETAEGWMLGAVWPQHDLRCWWRREGENFVFRITHPDTPDMFWTCTPDEAAQLNMRVIETPDLLTRDDRVH